MIKSIVAGIANGDQPPVMTGLYGNTAAVRAGLHDMGFDLTKATQDWTGQQKLIGTLNSATQVRIRQAVRLVKESLPLIRTLAQEWQAGGFPALNKARLETAKAGGLGPKAQSLATRIEAEINDITSELGTVYKGGNSSTDESLRLAASQLNANWSEQTLMDAIDLAETNIKYRENSLKLLAAGINQDNTYATNQAPPDAEPVGNAAAGLSDVRAGDVYDNPDTGESIRWDGQQWVPVD
jgi:hypothetical protein